MWIGILVSAIISAFLGVVFSDQIIKCVTQTFVKLGIKKEISLAGKWKAKCCKENAGEKVDEFTEIIELETRFGIILGYLSIESPNYKLFASSSYPKPLRVKGYLIDSRYFVGFWYHPGEKSRYHGVFHFIISPNLNNMDGKWLGYSEKINEIDNGVWVWEKE